MNIELPTKPIPAEQESPKSLFLYGPPKVGKTTATSFLDDYLLIDLEKGARFLSAVKVEINTINDLFGLIRSLKASEKKYKYGVIDTVSKLEDLVLPYAGQLYRETPMGEKWGLKEDGSPDPNASVLKLPKGAGYLYLREAFMKIIKAFEDCFQRLILCGHLKDQLLEREGKEVSTRDVDLSGKLKNILCAYSDCIGYMYREGPYTKVSFVTSQDTICGSRTEHLRNKEIILLDSEDGTLKHGWDKIYVD